MNGIWNLQLHRSSSNKEDLHVSSFTITYDNANIATLGQKYQNWTTIRPSTLQFWNHNNHGISGLTKKEAMTNQIMDLRGVHGDESWENMFNISHYVRGVHQMPHEVNISLMHINLWDCSPQKKKMRCQHSYTMALNSFKTLGYVILKRKIYWI